MRAVSQTMQASLDGPVTTLARCWRLTRRDGRVFAFTDHDEALTFAGTLFEAAQGLEAGEAERVAGLVPGTQEVRGALSALSLNEDEIAAGLFDGARVESFVADWQAPQAAHMHLSTARIGEVRRGLIGFTAELRGLEAELDRERGRRYRRRCDARLGDARCGVDLSRDGRTRPVRALATLPGGAVEVAGPLDGALDLFARGTLSASEGRNAGQSREIAGIGRGAGEDTWRVELGEPFAFEMEAGTPLVMVQGCDRVFSTCRDRFANAVNFRGFPHLPGEEAALAIAKQDGLHDGGAVVP